MQIINYTDIDLSKMVLTRTQGTKSSVYISSDKCYKILDGLYDYEKIQLLKKFKDMENLTINEILLPKELILDNNGLLQGYTMDNFKDSLNLYDYFTRTRFVDVNDILEATRLSSLILRKAHKEGIILQDFSFDNILINNESTIRICDIDGCKYKNNTSPFISMIMHNYYTILRKKINKLDENFDNQSLLLSMLLAIYHNMVFSIEEYDNLSDKIKTLKNIRNLVKNLLNDLDTKVPYLDEIICEDDHFIIDRNKQISLKKRILKDYKIN